MKPITVKFEREKETKNTVRFKEVTDDDTPPVIGTLYIRKTYAGDMQNITVTIESD